MSLMHFRCQLQRFVVGLDRILVILEATVKNTELKVKLGIYGIPPDLALQLPDGFQKAFGF